MSTITAKIKTKTNPDEILKAIEDYQNGQMGEIAEFYHCRGPQRD